MISAHDLNAVMVEHLASKFANGFSYPKQVLSRDGSPADDVLWLHHMDLRVEELATVGGFLRQRIAIAGRPASQDVANVQVFASQMAGRDDLVQKLTSGADKRFTFRVFFRSGASPINMISAAGFLREHGLLSATCKLLTSLTHGHSFRNCRESLIVLQRCRTCGSSHLEPLRSSPHIPRPTESATRTSPMSRLVGALQPVTTQLPFSQPPRPHWFSGAAAGAFATPGLAAVPGFGSSTFGR